jgi:hypothetical protein
MMRGRCLATGKAGRRVEDVERAGADSVQRGGGLRQARLTSERFSQTQGHRF